MADPEPGARGRRVLIVAADAVETKRLQVLLQSWGHEVRMVTSGPDAVTEAGQWLPHVVLAELRLRGPMDGLAVARVLQRNPATAGARLLALSAHGSSVDYSLEGTVFEEILTAPADPDFLRRLVGAS
jgi:CheY-like chemotaxis protein